MASEIDLPIPGVDKSKPDVSDGNITLILAGLLLPSKETSWLMAREIERTRAEKGKP